MLKPLNYHIIVKPLSTNLSKSGIVVTTNKPAPTLGQVKAISELSAKKSPQIKIGDFIIFEPNKGDAVPGGFEIMHVECALLIIKAKDEAEALGMLGELKQGALPALPNL